MDYSLIAISAQSFVLSHIFLVLSNSQKTNKLKFCLKVVFGIAYTGQLILLFNLFLLLFIGIVALSDTIHGSTVLFRLIFSLFIVLSAKNFQFQLNKMSLNGP